MHVFDAAAALARVEQRLVGRAFATTYSTGVGVVLVGPVAAGLGRVGSTHGGFTLGRGLRARRGGGSLGTGAGAGEAGF